MTMLMTVLLLFWSQECVSIIVCCCFRYIQPTMYFVENMMSSVKRRRSVLFFYFSPAPWLWLLCSVGLINWADPEENCKSEGTIKGPHFRKKSEPIRISLEHFACLQLAAVGSLASTPIRNGCCGNFDSTKPVDIYLVATFNTQAHLGRMLRLPKGTSVFPPIFCVCAFLHVILLNWCHHHSIFTVISFNRIFILWHEFRKTVQININKNKNKNILFVILEGQIYANAISFYLWGHAITAAESESENGYDTAKTNSIKYRWSDLRQLCVCVWLCVYSNRCARS